MSVFCTSCGQENGDGAAFCDSCGSSLAAGCANCGADNRPEARFCRSCGTRLTGGATPAAAAPSSAAPATAPATAPAASDATVAERRLVSVLFADLVAFTEYSEGRDAELVRDTLTRYFEVTRHAIEHHGGHVEKFIGDAVMAQWGAPRANEDDAERAVRAALEVTEAVRNLGEGLQARVAVLTGQAAVTVGATDQGMVAGDLVNTAARLQAAAPPSTVLVGEATMRAAAEAIAFEEAGEQSLKGKAAPVPAWRVLRVVGDRGGRSRGEGLEPPFVGREVELRLLKDLLHQIGDEQRPRLISITGPAGIGKSRLAWEFEKYLDGLVEDVYWHRGRAPSYGEGVTFWALGEMVRKRAGLLESDDEATTRTRIHETVDAWVPDQKDRDWVEPALLTLLGLEPAPAGGREVLFAAWRIFFERIARRGTTVMLFEDLQWADGGQLDFIDHVMEWAKGVPLLVVTLARPDLLERRPGWGTSARSFNTIGLEPLTDSHMRELLTGLVPDLPAQAIETILARADGIPLYAVETVRMLVSDGRLLANEDGTLRPAGDLGELAVPDSLRALIASRLDGLEEADRTLLQDAAVLGKTFTADALSVIYGQDREALEPRLRSLAKRELLEISVDPGSPERGQYGFVQSVIREVAYDTLSRRDRRTRHLAAARYFEGLGEDELAGVLSTHYLAAYEASDAGPEADGLRIQARLALKGAADRAIELGATDQALVLYGQALEITEDPAERAELLERAAHAADLEASYEEAIALGYDAIAQYEAAGDRTGVARTSALMGGLLADASMLQETRTFLLKAIEQADRAEEEPYRADMLARLSRAHMRLAEYEAAVATADRALAIAEPRRLKRIMAEALVNKAASLGGLGRLIEPVVLMSAAVELAHDAGDVALELRARNNLAAVQGSENGTAALEVSREAYELATRLGIRQMSTWLAGAIGLGAYYEGLDWDTAIGDMEAEIAGSRSDIDRRRLLLTVRVFLVARGQDTSAIDADLAGLRTESDDPETALWTTVMRGHAALFAGRPEDAIPIYREACRITSQNTGEARVGLALAAHLARDLDVAREAVVEIDKEVYSGNYIEGARALAAAGVAALDGRDLDALAGYRTAVDHIARNGARFHLALIQLDALFLLPDERAIDGWENEVRERFQVVGSPPLLERLDEVVYARRHGRDDGVRRVAADERRAVDALPDAAGPGGASA
jgi:class 3 adenylate cyclase/tetratricopeptide (TPR) repeat protein